MIKPRSERKALGKTLRKEVPRSSHSDWQPSADRPDPLSLLQEQDKGRLQYLVPIKYGRMAESSFAFLRGSAVVMAADLANTPSSGLVVQLCGDAHLSNFGVFATPERRLVFDINDFDETHPGPWEWDLKRLVASSVVAGRANGFGDNFNRKMALVTARMYAKTIRKLAEVPTLDAWYFNVEAGQVQRAFERSSKSAQKQAKQMISKARRKTQEQTLEKLTTIVNGRRRIVSEPPLLVPLGELLTEAQKDQLTMEQIETMWNGYLESLPAERQHLLTRFQLTDAALRVGGVGSVGTRCWIMLLEGGGEEDAIILQQKQAGPSVLEAYTAPSDYESPAARVVHGQRLIQAASDTFLGWHVNPLTGHHYYWRQLKDMKGSLDVTGLDKAGFKTYLRVCAVCLARAHARTGDATAIAAYIGKGDVLPRSMADFGLAYADQTETDHQILSEAILSGRIIADSEMT